jgi:glutamine synthetase
MEHHEILEKVQNENIKFIRLQFVDILGNVKNMEIPSSELKSALEKGIGFDGSSIEGFTRIQESDMIAMPDTKTFHILPWTTGDVKSARIICNIRTPEGILFDGDPRNIIQRQIEKGKELFGSDFVFNVGAELEFFLLKKDEKGKYIPHDQGGYFDFSPMDSAFDVRAEAIVAMQKMGLEFEKGHHEVAPGQHEIDFRFGSALKVADQTITYKFVVRNLAKQHGIVATFMPKPFEGMNGSGMHSHQSIFAGGRNLFFDIHHSERGYLSDIAMKFIGGILAHAKALVAITNPSLNSYKRLVPGYEAPVYVCWGKQNRSAMIRVPNFFPGHENATRIELRVPDSSCNPYLAFSAMLACGLDGIKNNIWPPEEAGNNIYHMSEEERKRNGIQTLPGNLKEAIDNLKQDNVLKDMLGEHTFSKFIEAKEKEIAAGEVWDPDRI